MLQIALAAYETITYRDDVDLAMSEARLPLKYRVPDKQRLEWAQRIVAAMGDRPPKDTTEVYAREQIILHERQATEIVVQAVRIGDIGDRHDALRNVRLDRPEAETAEPAGQRRW